MGVGGPEGIEGGEIAPAGEGELFFGSFGDDGDGGVLVAAEMDFDAAEELEVFEEEIDVGGGHELQAADFPEEFAGVGLVERGVLVAETELEKLGEEFEVHEAAGAGFEGAFGRLDGIAFAFDAEAHFPEALEFFGGGGFCVKEFVDEGGPFGGEGTGTGDDAGAGEELFFPVLGVFFVVFADAGEGDDEGTVFSVGAEAEIGGVDGAVGGAVGEDFEEGLDGAGVVLRGFVGAEDEEIEVGAEIHFAAAVFSEGDDEEMSARIEAAEEEGENGVGEDGEVFLGFLLVEKSEEFADGDADLLGFDVEPEPVFEIFGGGAELEFADGVGGVFAAAEDFGAENFLENFWVADEEIADEFAAVEEKGEDFEEGGIEGAGAEKLAAGAVGVGEAGDALEGAERVGELRHDLVELFFQADESGNLVAGEGVVAAALDEVAHGSVRIFAVAEPAAEGGGDGRVDFVFGEEIPPVGERFVGGSVFEDFGVAGADAGADFGEFLGEFGGARKTEGFGDGFELGAVGREGVGLLFLAHLETVFDVAEEPVGVAEEFGVGFFHEPVADELGEALVGGVGLEKRETAGVEELHRLDDELDFADAAEAAFDVAVEIGGADDLAFRAELHESDFGKEGGGRVARVAEGVEAFEEFAAEFEVSGDGAGFDESHALPALSGDGVVIFGAGEGADERAAGTFGAEAEIGAEEETVFGLFAEKMGEGFGDFGEETLVGGAGGFVVFPAIAVAFVEIDEVDVGGEIQFLAAEFSEGEDAETGGFFQRFIPGISVAGGPLVEGGAVAFADAELGEAGEFENALLDGLEAVDVAVGDAEADFAAEEAEGGDGVGREIGGGGEEFFPLDAERFGGNFGVGERLEQPGEEFGVVEEDGAVERRKAGEAVEAGGGFGVEPEGGFRLRLVQAGDQLLVEFRHGREGSLTG